MKTEIKIIKAFLRDREPRTIRGIAKEIKADYRITHTAFQRLIQKGIIEVKKVGKSSLCSFNDERYGLEIHQAEEERKNHLLKNKDINQL